MMEITTTFGEIRQVKHLVWQPVTGDDAEKHGNSGWGSQRFSEKFIGFFDEMVSGGWDEYRQ
jgi:hypothetical protein